MKVEVPMQVVSSSVHVSDLVEGDTFLRGGSDAVWLLTNTPPNAGGYLIVVRLADGNYDGALPAESVTRVDYKAIPL